MELLIFVGVIGISLVEVSFLVFWIFVMIRSCEFGLVEGFNLVWLENGLVVEEGGIFLLVRTYVSCCLIV